MELLQKSDAEILTLATDTIEELIAAGNKKDWEKFSAPMVAEGKTKDGKQEVLNQWKNNPVITSFHPNPEFLGIFRKSDHLVTLWKLKSDNTPDDVMGLLAFTEEDNEIRVYGFRVM